MLGHRPSREQSRTKKAKKRISARSSKTNGVINKKVKRASVKAKYRDGKTGDTWSGRGRMASWLKSKQDAGEKIEKYLLN